MKDNETKIVHELPQIDITKINQVYLGKQGCACGCGGNYHETERMKKTALTKLEQRASEGLEINVGLAEDKSIISWEGETRAVRIYTQQDVYNEVRA